MLQHTNCEPSDQSDHHNQDARNRVALYELAGPIHGSVEIRLLRHFLTTLAGLLLVDQPGVQIGIDRHLLTWHRIQCETRAHLGNPTGTFGHYDEVNNHQNHEYDETHGIVAAYHHLTERLNHTT